MVIFEVVTQKFVTARLYSKQPSIDKLWDVYVDFNAELFSRIHSQMPAIMMKEIAIAQCMSKNCLLIPRLPSEVSQDPKLQLKAVDIRLNEDGKREEYKTSSGRMEKWCNVLFVCMRQSAYIGRAWQYVVIYLNMQMMQQSSQLIYHVLHMTGDRLVVTYRKAFIQLLSHVIKDWIPKYENYSQTDMYTEV